ncbi:MAG TPA: PEP-utilizing enzyme [Candidatus Nanoarchaeia archaeon]|nr:PEP-utilizing enzyme [Candidatus Nanoarchaeia archaeon]
MVNKDMIGLLKQHGLHTGPKRRMSFFSMTSVTRGYTQELHQHLGFSYEVLGAMVEGNQTLSVVNDSVVAAKVKKFLEKFPEKLDKDIFPLTEKYLQENNNPEMLHHHSRLKNILSFYPYYFSIIGIYNALNRYVKETSHDLLTEEQLEKIGYFRNELGGMYPIVDDAIVEQLEQYPQGKMLSYLTFGEMKQFLTDGTIPQNVPDRPQGCVYLYLEKEDRELIVTEKTTVAECSKLLYPAFDPSLRVLTGQSAYAGKVQGTVAIMPRNSELPADAIIVTSMTTVNQTPLIVKARAVVADEGGILCHAAIIARELKKPCIVGTKFGSRIFKEGDFVEVDADKGIIRKL